MKRAPKRGNALVLVIGLAGLAVAAYACAPKADTSLPVEDRLLEDVMEVYFAERFRFFPVESTLSGLPGNDDRLGSFARADIDARVSWLADFHYKLLGLRLTELSQPAYLDAIWLTSLVKAELFELEQRQLWNRTAAFYGDQIRLGLVSLLAEGELATRVEALAGRLAAITPLLEQARENLGPVQPIWRADGVRSLESCRRLLLDLPQMLEGRLPPPRVAELAELSRAATRSVQRLMADAPRPTGDDPAGFLLGEEGLRRYFLYEHMMDWSPDTILALAEAELEIATHELTQLALTHFASESLLALLAPKPPLEAVELEVAEASERVAAFVRERDLSLSSDVSPPVRLVPFYFPGRAPVVLWRPKALEPARGTFLMVRGGEPVRVDRSELQLLTLREVGGRARQFAYQAQSASLLRRVLATETTREGWLLEFEREALDEGFEPENLELRLRHQHRRMLAFVRLMAVVEMHAHGRSFEEMVTLFRERGLLSLAASRNEATRVAVDPGVSDPAAGWLALNELAVDYASEHPLETRSELTRQILTEGLPPMRLIRFRLLGASSGFH